MENREIKFRVWDGNKMHYPCCDSNATNHHFQIGSGNFFLFNEKGEIVTNSDIGGFLLQFTGLKDKNGVDIYERDILRLTYKEEHIMEDYSNPSDVIYSEIDFRFSARCMKDAEHGLQLNWGGYKSLEVIGNIYENPELL